MQSSKSRLNIDKIQCYMRENITANIDIDSLARKAYLSKFHFIKTYKLLTGFSPKKHFIHMKMDYACHLLDSSPNNIGAIAEQLGYSDQFYFSKIFRKTFGLTPSDYRKRPVTE